MFNKLLIQILLQLGGSARDCRYTAKENENKESNRKADSQAKKPGRGELAYHGEGTPIGLPKLSLRAKAQRNSHYRWRLIYAGEHCLRLLRLWLDREALRGLERIFQCKLDASARC